MMDLSVLQTEVSPTFLALPLVSSESLFSLVHESGLSLFNSQPWIVVGQLFSLNRQVLKVGIPLEVLSGIFLSRTVKVRYF
jgi:hypothetical protein